MTNILYYGDNLPILRSISTTSVDLDYLEPPTRDMEQEALYAGLYTSPVWEKDYPVIQILTIEQLLNGAEVHADYLGHIQARRKD